MATQGVMANSVPDLFLSVSTTQGSQGAGSTAKAGNQSFDNYLKQNVNQGKEVKKEPVQSAVQNTNTKNVFSTKDVSDHDVSIQLENDDVQYMESEGIDLVDPLSEKVSKLVSETISLICDVLEITEEELTDIMELMGLALIDLFNPQTLQQIVLAESGTEDVSLLLLDETAANQFKELLQGIGQLTEEYDLTYEQLDENIVNQSFAEYLESNLENMTVTTDQVQVEQDAFEDGNILQARPQVEVKPDSKVKDEIEPDEEVATEKEILFEAVKVKEDGTADTDSGKQGKSDLSKESQQVTQSQQFVDNIADAFTLKEADFSEQVEQAAQIRDIANQIMEQIKITIRPTQTSLEIQLNPEHLGKINLSIVSKDGALTAHFTAQNQISKEAIESNIQMLRENLENQGIKVEAIEVNISEYAFNRERDTAQGQEKKEQQSSKKKGLHFDDELDFEDVIMTDDTDQMILDGQSSVSYTA